MKVMLINITILLLNIKSIRQHTYSIRCKYINTLAHESLRDCAHALAQMRFIWYYIGLPGCPGNEVKMSVLYLSVIAEFTCIVLDK